MRNWLILVLAVLSVSVSAQEMKTVKGLVVDSQNDEPLVGVSVRLPASELKRLGIDVSRHTATTGLDGRFSVQLPAQAAQLEFGYIGYTTATAAARDGMTVRMRPSEAFGLDEVVVTGYQQIERRKLTAAIQTVKVSDDIVGSAMSIDQALAGQVAGLASVTQTGAPGSAPKLRIRGTSSLNGTQDPLWVLDGIPLEGSEVPSMDDLKDINNIYSTSIAGINPSDIETITVLKDAAATAIYGARAANGVIVITTKRGKEGRPKVTFSTRLTYSPKTNIDRLNLLTSSEKVDLELALLQSDYTYRQNKGEVARIINSASEMDAYKSGGLTALSPTTQQAIAKLRQTQTDWNDILFRSVFNQEYNASISGGGDRSTYYTSLGYTDEQGNTRGTEANRLNLTAKTTYRLNSRLKVGASLFANRRLNKANMTDADGFTNPTYYSRRANPYQQPYDSNGNYVYDTDIQGREDSDLKFNIFEERANTDYRLETKSLTAILDGEYRFCDLLKATTQIGIQVDDATKTQYAGGDTYAMRKDVERTTMASLGYTSFLPSGGKKSTSNSSNKQLTWKLQGEYSQNIRNTHEMQAMIGTEIRKTWYESTTATGYGYDTNTLQVKPVIYPNEQWAKLYPLYSESYTESAFASFFATGSYSYRGRYVVGGSVRFDGSDMFGVAKKYRFVPLYSVSGLWRISQESFMKQARWIDNLSLRLSYGVQGNIDKNTSSYVLGDYTTTTILPGNTERVLSVSSPPNTRLRWEKTKTASAGIDLSVLGGALALSVDAYTRKGVDLIATRMLTLESGFASMLVNWASMRNQGVELNLQANLLRKSDLKWSANLNFAYNDNKVLQEEIPDNQTTPGRQGYPVGAIFALRSAGLDDEGWPLFYNNAGEKVTATELLKLNSYGASTLTAEEQRNLYTYMGSSEPLYTGGLLNRWTYKGWELSANLFFNLKMAVRCTPSYSPTNYDRGMNSNRDILNRWTTDNTQTSLPRLMNSTDRPAEYIQYSEFALYSMLDTWVKNVSYVRLQNLRLAYTLPSALTQKMGMSRLTLALEGRNLFAFGSDYTNYLDRETMGNEFAQPIQRSYSLSVNMSF